MMGENTEVGQTVDPTVQENAKEEVREIKGFMNEQEKLVANDDLKALTEVANMTVKYPFTQKNAKGKVISVAVVESSLLSEDELMMVKSKIMNLVNKY